jgi:hypothetical protein
MYICNFIFKFSKKTAEKISRDFNYNVKRNNAKICGVCFCENGERYLGTPTPLTHDPMNYEICNQGRKICFLAQHTKQTMPNVEDELTNCGDFCST